MSNDILVEISETNAIIDCVQSEVNETNDYMFAIDVYKLGHKYHLNALMEFSENKLKQMIRNENIANIYGFANEFELNELTNQLKTFVNTNYDSIVDKDSEELREIVTKLKDQNDVITDNRIDFESDDKNEDKSDDTINQRIDESIDEGIDDRIDDTIDDKSDEITDEITDRIDDKINDKSDKLSSKSSDVEFDDLSDTPESNSSSDDDEDYQINGKSQNRAKTQRLSKYERLAKDFRLKYNPFVELINLTTDLIEKSFGDASVVCNRVHDLEKELKDKLLLKGVICRKIPVKKKVNKESEDSNDEEIKRLCRIPKLNIAKNHLKKRIQKKRKDLNEKEVENSDSENTPKEKKKLKKSNGFANENGLDSDCEDFNTVNNNSVNIKMSETSKTVDVLDSEVSSDEEINKKVIRTRSKAKEIKSEKKVKTEKEDSDEDKSDVKSKDKFNGNSNNNRVLKNESSDENNDKTVIDIDSNSEEEIISKKRVSKRKVSDDEYEEEDKESNDNEDSDIISESESSGMDPSARDSDSDSDSKTKRKKSKQKPKKGTKGKRRRVVTQDSSDDEDIKVLSGDDSDSPNKSRKNIKKIISDKKLKQQTKDAAEAERDRRKRIEERQKEYYELIKTRGVKSANVKEVILEFDKDTKEVLVAVDETLVKHLKPHQVDGIKFMYDCTIETIDRLETSEGSGCILAHSMGLGKTLQVISFLHTVLSHKAIKKYIKRALVICPVNTIKNWAHEFRMWLNDNDLDDILVFEMHDAKSMPQRGELMNIWHKRGGVLIIGLTLFSSMVQGGRGKKPSKYVRDAIQKCLIDPGPEIVICDEGHLLKNEKTAYNKAVSKIKSIRRVVLTGTPLQNNLNEYHVMVDFVKPSLLGTKKEFTNRFVNPITNGQHVDSTDYDVKIMKKRVHILHTLLNGCVHRCDYNVLVPYLQPKHEFVISVSLSEKQIDLYSYYITNLTDKQRFSLLADYGVLRLIWNHPVLLFEQHQRKLEKAEDDSLDEFINDDDVDTPVSGDSDIEYVDQNKAGPSKPRRRIKTRFGKVDTEEEEEEEVVKEENNDDNVWFKQYLKREESFQIELSGKFILLFSILEECEKMGDKILLFTQSLDTLDLVEELLRIRSEKAREESRNSIPEIDLDSSYTNDLTSIWVKNIDYFRLDGSTGSDYRKAWIDIFNDEKNHRARLFMLSTKAGGLGINLVGANRCIIFDASWNPTHDVQAIFRIFRFGQKKPVYVYRFVAQGTMEEKIYERQIIKQSLACRVVDEQSIQRHFKASELSELYIFNPDRNKDRPTPKVPKDRLLAELLIKHKEYIVKYHEHDSLLENKPDEDMSEAEKKAAWDEYEQEKDALFIREQQEVELRRQREFFMAQQQQQAQQQYQQQQQQQQYAQQIYQQYQQFNTTGSTADTYQTLLSKQIYQNIMKSQENLRKQQLQQYHLLLQQQQKQAPKPATVLPQPTQSTEVSNGLPGYDSMTVEDIAKYVKAANSAIEPPAMIERIFGIITNGQNTCQKELELIKVQLKTNPSNELNLKYTKLAKEVYNLNLQRSRAQSLFKASVRTGPNILRQNAYQTQPTVVEPEEYVVPTTSGKPSSVLIEEVD